MKHRDQRPRPRSPAPRIHRRLRGRGRRRAGARVAPALWRDAGIGSAEAKSAAAAEAEVNAWVVVKPDDTVRDPHRALGDGPGHAHRPRPARRRGARVRLEEGHDRLDHPRAEPRPQARLGRDGDRRQPRHPHLPGLRPPRRRGGAHDAAAGGGRPVEGAGERAHRGRRRHHARGLEALDDLRQGRRRGGQPRRRRTRRASRSRIRRTGRSPASR